MWKVAPLLVILGLNYITEISCLEIIGHFLPEEHDHAHDHAHAPTGNEDLQWYTEMGPDGVAREVQLTRSEINRRVRELQAKGVTDTRYYGSSGLIVPDGPPHIDHLRPGDVIPGTGDPYVTAAIEEEKRRAEMERMRQEQLEQERRIKELEKKLALEKKKKKKTPRTRRPGRRHPSRNRGRRPTQRVTQRVTPASAKRPPPPPRPTPKPRGFLQRLIARGRKNVGTFIDRLKSNSRPGLRGGLFIG